MDGMDQNEPQIGGFLIHLSCPLHLCKHKKTEPRSEHIRRS